ncbi:MAG: DNA/RNA non-specific endonuclease [Candidatus Sulfotelmatobacter sp.]
MALPDISAQFQFPPVRTLGNFSYKEAFGELGVPGKVATHRLVAEQKKMSKGTGEHAGHMIGTQFGAPGDVRNLSLQNPNMNTFAPKALQPAFQGHGGSYHDLESRWTALLKDGYRIRVTVRDKYRKGENRPFSRWVQWIETKPGASSGQTKELEFGNFSSPQQRAANQ